jgi:aspartyl-tRNA(Asn)/glutamyl-tRNA(Gln) amidotransferase subunit C
MKLTRHEVQNIAQLARLDLAEADIEAFTGKLSDIITFVNQLESAATDDTVPMAHPLDMDQPQRADQVTETDRRDDYQRNAPAVERGLYLVPRVIE